MKRARRHPSAIRGIVEIYDFGYHTGGSAYIVMEFLAGESIAARMCIYRMQEAERA
jgi:serine/threonine protein kinase